MKKIKNMSSAIEYARLLREKFLADPTRPGYHFAVPEDIGMPGDPNGAFFAGGRYHLMFLYDCRSDSFRWGHISSIDLVHWRARPDAVVPDKLDGGIFSGGAFVDDDGACYMTYWGLPVKGQNQGGIRIAKSPGPPYDRWVKFAEYALACTESGVLETAGPSGEPLFLGCADPSNIWKKNGVYYMQAGNLSVLLKFKRDGLHDRSKDAPDETPVPENIRGDWTDLYKSPDLNRWEHAGRFYERDQTGIWTAADEDDMCPSFLPLPKSKDGGEASGKYLQLFISHNRGCQYYIGDYDKKNDRFVPGAHGRMTWNDNTFFAPEALIDGKGRQIMWAWLLDNKDGGLEDGWSGVYGLPRCLWLNEYGGLGIAPVPEIRSLRYNGREFGAFRLKNNKHLLENINGESCEITFSADMADAAETGVIVRASQGGSEYTKIYVSKADKQLVFDARQSGKAGRRILETAPFELAAGEDLRLTVFIDKSVVEVFANDRQAITRRVYPSKPESVNAYLFSSGETAFKNVTVYEMMPANFC